MVSTAAPHKRRMCLVEMEERARERENEEIGASDGTASMTPRLLKSPFRQKIRREDEWKGCGPRVRSSPVQCTRQSPPTYTRTALTSSVRPSTLLSRFSPSLRPGHPSPKSPTSTEHVFRLRHLPDRPCSSRRPPSLTTPSLHRPPPPPHVHPAYPSTPT